MTLGFENLRSSRQERGKRMARSHVFEFSRTRRQKLAAIEAPETSISLSGEASGGCLPSLEMDQ